MQEGPALRDLEMPLVVNLSLDVTDLLADVLYAHSGSIDLSAGGGVVTTFFTVPEDERWELIGWSITAVASSSAAQVINRQGEAIHLLFQGTAVSSETERSFMCEPGWTITRTTTGNGSDTSESMAITYKRWFYK